MKEVLSKNPKTRKLKKYNVKKSLKFFCLDMSNHNFEKAQRCVDFGTEVQQEVTTIESSRRRGFEEGRPSRVTDPVHLRACPEINAFCCGELSKEVSLF